MVRPRPEVLKGSTYKVRTGCGSLYVTINQDDNGEPFEVFLRAGKSGGCASAQCEAIGRLVSAVLRGGLGLELAIHQLKGISCHSVSKDTVSCASGVGTVLEKFHENHKGQRDGIHGDRQS